MELARPAWGSSDDVQRRMLANLLFQFGRITVQRFMWEEFDLAYRVFDVCYEVLRLRHVESRVRHRERIDRVCDRLGIPRAPTDVVERVVGLRNELTHELGWGGYLLGHGYPDDSPSPHLVMQSLLERTILGLLGVRAAFVTSPWWGVGAISTHLLQVRTGD